MNTLFVETATYYFEIRNNLLLASWPHHVRSESPEFLQSLQVLFDLIREKQVTRLFLDSGTPEGGALTEEVIACMKKEVCRSCPLKKVALLESVDYHWDNNIMQVFNYLKLTLALEVQIRMFSSRDMALNWLTDHF